MRRSSAQYHASHNSASLLSSYSPTHTVGVLDLFIYLRLKKSSLNRSINCSSAEVEVEDKGRLTAHSNAGWFHVKLGTEI